MVIVYGGKMLDIWWQGVCSKVEWLCNVQVLLFVDGVVVVFGWFVECMMCLQCMVQDGVVWILSVDYDLVVVEWMVLKVCVDV